VVRCPTVDQRVRYKRGRSRTIEPQTLRKIGTASIVFGVVGLAFTLLLVGLVATGTTEPPSTFMAIWIPIQSTVNVASGWSLRRRAGQLAR